MRAYFHRIKAAVLTVMYRASEHILPMAWDICSIDVYHLTTIFVAWFERKGFSTMAELPIVKRQHSHATGRARHRRRMVILNWNLRGR